MSRHTISNAMVPSGTHALLDTRSRLQTNPDLIIWPGDTLTFFLLDRSGNPGEQFALPEPALNLLRRFSQPQTLTQVFNDNSTEIRATIKECVVQKLLLKLDGHSGPARPSPDSERWAGFRFSDLANPPHVRDKRKVITRRHSLADKQILVLDRVLPQTWVQSVHRWFFQLPVRRIDVDTSKTSNARHWTNLFQPAAQFERMVPIFSLLATLTRSLSPFPNLKLQRIHAYVSPFGDLQFPHRDIQRGKGITAVYFGNSSWEDEWMSEMVFYNENDEPALIVPPKPGRLIVFRGDLLHRAGAPSSLSPEPRYSLVFRYLKSEHPRRRFPR